MVNINLSKYVVDWDAKCRSIVQFKVKQFLKQYWQGYLCYEEMPCAGSLLKCDFVNMGLKICVETQGAFHHGYNSWAHKGNPQNFLHSLKNDIKKAKWLEDNGIQLVEIMEDEIPLLSKTFFLEKFGILL